MPSVRLGDALVSRSGTWNHVGTDGHPEVAIHFEVRNGRPECVEITIRAKTKGRGIQTSDIESLRLDQLAVQVFAQHAWPIVDGELHAQPTADLSEADPRRIGVGKAVHEARYGRRGSISDVELMEVAEIYRQYVDGKPIVAIMKILGEDKGWSERTAQRRVQLARQRGFLSKGEPGKKKA